MRKAYLDRCPVHPGCLSRRHQPRGNDVFGNRTQQTTWNREPVAEHGPLTCDREPHLRAIV
jgi:hypothetical protein